MGQRTAVEKSAIVAAAGWLMGVVTALMLAVKKLGGTDEQVYRLATPAGADLIDHMAALITGKVAPSAPVDWWNKLLGLVITACQFVSYINPAITGVNFPYEPGDLDERELVEVTIDRTMTTEEVLAKIAALDLRPARLVDLLRWWLANPGRHVDCLVVALGSVFEGKVPYVNGNGDNRNLNLNDLVNKWNSNYVFLAVRQSSHSPALIGGSFFFKRCQPPTDHFSNFC